jgi:hypothetical protein
MRDIVAKYGPGGFRTERSLFVKVAEAKNLGEEKDTYVAIVVDGVHKARTPTVFRSSAPLFAQEYDMDLESEAEILTFQLKHNNKKKDGDMIGSVSIRFTELAGGAVIEKWFPLSSVSDSIVSAVSSSSFGSSASSSGMGSSSTSIIGNVVVGGTNASSSGGDTSNNLGEIRLAIQYSSVTVLADDSYDHLFRLLLKDKMAATILMSQASAKKEKIVADCLVKAFEARKTGAHYIKTIIQSEIENTANPNIIFRGNTVGTKSVDTYMRLVGLPYLSAVLGPIIQEIFQGKKSCELDTQRISGGSKEKTAEKNLGNLLSYCKRIFEAISSSFNRCPASFRNIFEYMQEVVVKKFPEDEVIRYTAPGGFIFLRFFCPALLGPKLFNLANDHPPENVARDLTLIAKTIQNLANLVPFGQKEPYMEGVNAFITEYSPQMKVFLDTLCSPPKEAIDEISSKISLNFGREIARIHAHMAASIPIMAENIKTKGDIPEQVAYLEEIKSVINNLNQELINGPNTNPVPPSSSTSSSSTTGGSGTRPSTPVITARSSGIPNVPGTSTPTASSTSPASSVSSNHPVLGGGLQPSSSTPSVTGPASSSPSTDESANSQSEAMLLKRKLHHLQFIQEQQAKLLELEKALSTAQAQ